MSKPAVCKDICDWNLMNVQKSSNTSSNKEQNQFKQHIQQQCDINIDTNLMLKSCWKRLVRATKKRAALIKQHVYELDNDTCPSQKYLENMYKEVRNFLQTNKYFFMSHEPATIQFKSNAPNPYYNDNKFVYGEGLCSQSVLKTILIHECDPGHHYMFSRLDEEPMTQSSNKPNQALIEGWALYAERYHPDEHKYQIAYLTSVIIRTCRTIIDIQLNQNHWSLEQAKEFLNKYYPMKQQIDYELKRVKQQPGFNTCYVAGEHFFVQLYLDYANKYKSIADYHERLMQVLKQCIKSNQCSMQSIKKHMQHSQ